MWLVISDTVTKSVQKNWSGVVSMIDPYWICMDETGAGEKYIMLNLLCESFRYM